MPVLFCLTRGLLTTKGGERGTTCNGQYGEALGGGGGGVGFRFQASAVIQK